MTHFYIKLAFPLNLDMHINACNIEEQRDVKTLRIMLKRKTILTPHPPPPCAHTTRYQRHISQVLWSRWFLNFAFIYLVFSDVQWLWNQDASRDLLLAIHPPNYIVLWNADTGTKLWKKSYADNILSFSFDPFDPSHLTCEYWFLVKSESRYL